MSRLTLKPIVCVLAALWAVVPEVKGGIRGTVLFPSAVNLTTTQSNSVAVATADIDGDGWADVAVSSNNPEKVVWYRNNGDGTFASTQYVVTTSTSSSAFSNVSVADLNTDGRPDVVYWNGTSIKWSPNLGGSNPVAQFGYDAGNITANQFSVATTPSVETYVGTADFNGDTRPDVHSMAINPDRTVAWVPNLAGGFDPSIAVSTAGNEPTSVQGMDLDQDGWNDLLVTSAVDNTVAWFRNLGGGSFGSRQVITNTQTFARHAAVGDLNGDGRLDVVCVGSPFGLTAVRWFAGNAPGSTPLFGPAANIVTEILSGGYMVALRDLNSDGWLDVILAATFGNKVVWCENLGGGNFGTVTSNQNLIGTLNIPLSMAAVDFDQNGTVDVVVNSNSQAKVSVYRNFGGQTAMETADTAPATLMEGRRDAALRVAVSNRGVTGDSAAQLDVLSLRFESSPGVPLDSAQANALLDKVAVHHDADSSDSFDPANDPAVATLTQLTLTGGVLSFPLAGSLPGDVQIAPGATRTYFVVLKMAELAAQQIPNSVRVSHISHGIGRSIVRDATTSSALTIESASVVNAPSGFVTALPAHTFTDYAHLYFDSATDPGTGAIEDFDSDGSANLVEFGFGMDPTTSGSGNIVVSGGLIAQRGLPVAMATNTGTGVTYQAVFARRKDPLAALTYTVQFSANLSTWVSSSASPIVLADDGTFEAVAVPYPFFVNGKKARFFRVQVASP